MFLPVECFGVYVKCFYQELTATCFLGVSWRLKVNVTKFYKKKKNRQDKALNLICGRLGTSKCKMLNSLCQQI